ncbi:hypothetical protein BGW42_008236 [Actinomortierella wolfii]|nr:hypothetical protein BGW42_008236 [Actinomortierella wolfii]
MAIFKFFIKGNKTSSLPNKKTMNKATSTATMSKESLPLSTMSSATTIEEVARTSTCSSRSSITMFVPATTPSPKTTSAFNERKPTPEQVLFELLKLHSIGPGTPMLL